MVILNMDKRYTAFTLIEMLVVMGILIILMVVGIAAGRFALFRAADVAHRNAADQLFQGLQAYFVDHGSYPRIDSCGFYEAGGEEHEVCNPAKLMCQSDKLKPFMDIGAFNGGSDATFFYFTGGDNYNQAALICVSMRGLHDTNKEHSEGAYYCSGNAFSVGPLLYRSSTDFLFEEIDRSLIERDDEDELWIEFANLSDDAPNSADWVDQRWVSDICN